jgi:hypothetical protein
MKQGAAIMVMLLTAVAPQASHACSYTQAPEAVGQTSGEYFAKMMSAAATYVDLVLVEDDGTRPMGQPETGIITVRTIARFKGNSADQYSLFGVGLTLKPEAERAFQAPLEHFTSEIGQVSAFPYSEERPTALFAASVDGPAAGVPPPPPAPSSSCSPPSIAAETGRFYVVMRGPDGRLLNHFRTSDRNEFVFGFVPVRLEAGDFWLGAVLRANFDRPVDKARPILLRLRPGSDPVRVEAVLRRAGVRIGAAYVRIGNMIDEVRPADTEAQGPWLAKAVPFVLQHGKGRLGDPNHSAAEFMRAKLGPMQREGGGLGYGVAQAFIASIRATQRRKTGVNLAAVEISGSPDAFAREPFFAGIGPLERDSTGLAQVVGANEAAQFDAQQRIERDIWLLNGGGGNQQGTLPR